MMQYISLHALGYMYNLYVHEVYWAARYNTGLVLFFLFLSFLFYVHEGG